LTTAVIKAAHSLQPGNPAKKAAAIQDLAAVKPDDGRELKTSYLGALGAIAEALAQIDGRE